MHHLMCVVDCTFKVGWIPANPWSDEDAARYLSDNAGQDLVELDSSWVFATGEIVLRGNLDLLTDFIIHACLI